MSFGMRCGFVGVGEERHGVEPTHSLFEMKGDDEGITEKSVSWDRMLGGIMRHL